jgi:hypothetical protein
MKKIRNLAVSSLVGLALTFGLAGVASAAGTTTTTSGSPTGGSTTTTTPPKGSTPTKVKDQTLAGNQIWEIVNHSRKIECGRASKALAGISRADLAAGKRLTRLGKRSAAVAKMSASKKTDRLAEHASHRTRYFQHLQKEGAALIKRIEAKCGVTATTS